MVWHLLLILYCGCVVFLLFNHNVLQYAPWLGSARRTCTVAFHCAFDLPYTPDLTLSFVLKTAKFQRLAFSLWLISCRSNSYYQWLLLTRGLLKFHIDSEVCHLLKFESHECHLQVVRMGFPGSDRSAHLEVCEKISHTLYCQKYSLTHPNN